MLLPTVFQVCVCKRSEWIYVGSWVPLFPRLVVLDLFTEVFTDEVDSKDRDEKNESCHETRKDYHCNWHDFCGSCSKCSIMTSCNNNGTKRYPPLPLPPMLSLVTFAETPGYVIRVRVCMLVHFVLFVRCSYPLSLRFWAPNTLKKRWTVSNRKILVFVLVKTRTNRETSSRKDAEFSSRISQSL